MICRQVKFGAKLMQCEESLRSLSTSLLEDYRPATSAWVCPCRCHYCKHLLHESRFSRILTHKSTALWTCTVQQSFGRSLGVQTTKGTRLRSAMRPDRELGQIQKLCEASYLEAVTTDKDSFQTSRSVTFTKFCSAFSVFFLVSHLLIQSDSIPMFVLAGKHGHGGAGQKTCSHSIHSKGDVGECIFRVVLYCWTHRRVNKSLSNNKLSLICPHIACSRNNNCWPDCPEHHVCSDKWQSQTFSRYTSCISLPLPVLLKLYTFVKRTWTVYTRTTTIKMLSWQTDHRLRILHLTIVCCDPQGTVVRQQRWTVRTVL